MTPRCRHSFTLIELLAVVAIIAVLVALGLPALAKAQRQSFSNGCLANLRTIGMGIQLYATDHDMYLPGPAYPSFGGYYSNPKTNSAFLCDHLWQYLNLPTPTAATGWNGFSRVFVCPAYYQRVGTNMPNGRNGSYTTQPYLYVDGTRAPMSAGSPFGTIAQSSIPQPIRLNTISPIDLQNTNYWAVSDLDSAVDASGGQWLPGSTVITSPIHGNYRNRLFFDFHVEATRFR